MRKIKSVKYSAICIEQFNSFENFIETFIFHINEMSKKYINKIKDFPFMSQIDIKIYF